MSHFLPLQITDRENILPNTAVSLLSSVLPDASTNEQVGAALCDRV